MEYFFYFLCVFFWNFLCKIYEITECSKWEIPQQKITSVFGQSRCALSDFNVLSGLFLFAIHTMLRKHLFILKFLMSTTLIHEICSCVCVWRSSNIHILSKLIQFSFTRPSGCMCLIFFFSLFSAAAAATVNFVPVSECVAPSVFNTIVANNPISSWWVQSRVIRLVLLCTNLLNVQFWNVNKTRFPLFWFYAHILYGVFATKTAFASSKCKQNRERER